ncbi:unnamed protein product, partial [Effrenium voratum]
QIQLLERGVPVLPEVCRRCARPGAILDMAAAGFPWAPAPRVLQGERLAAKRRPSARAAG